MTEKNISYRRIRPEDNAAIAGLVREGLKNHGLDIPGTAYFDPHLEHLYEYYTEKPGKRNYFVAADEDAGGTPVGGIGIDEFEGLAGCAELQKLYVTPRAQKRGVASTLIRMLEEEALRLGYSALYIETHSNLQDALRLYEKAGFEQIGKPAFAVHDTMDRFLIKRLDGGAADSACF